MRALPHAHVRHTCIAPDVVIMHTYCLCMNVDLAWVITPCPHAHVRLSPPKVKIVIDATEITYQASSVLSEARVSYSQYVLFHALPPWHGMVACIAWIKCTSRTAMHMYGFNRHTHVRVQC